MILNGEMGENGEKVITICKYCPTNSTERLRNGREVWCPTTPKPRYKPAASYIQITYITTSWRILWEAQETGYIVQDRPI
jgi:hypothetical protein